MNINAPLNTHIPGLRQLWTEAFGDSDEFLDLFFKTAFSPNRCRCITQETSVVAALYWFDCSHKGQKIAYVYAVATSLSHRGQGLCHKLMEDTHVHLKNLGYQHVLLVPGSESLFHFYQSIGYQICSYINEIHLEAASAPDSNSNCSFQEIDKHNFAALRQQYLPEGSVIQTDENLNFLETMAKFYVGNRFLLAACRRGNDLLGIELLGDASVAPYLLSALGYKKGTFRTPGTERAFSMYYPLINGAVPPTYFGFAFD